MRRTKCQYAARMRRAARARSRTPRVAYHVATVKSQQCANHAALSMPDARRCCADERAADVLRDMRDAHR